MLEVVVYVQKSGILYTLYTIMKLGVVLYIALIVVTATDTETKFKNIYVWKWTKLK
jgi:hypothetical protein